MKEEQFVKELPDALNNFSAWMEDEHSAPQSDFIAGIDMSRSVFFKCDNNLSSNVKHFLETKEIFVEPPEPLNVQPQNELYAHGVSIWKSIFDNPEYLNRFQQNYAKDYDLINQIKFYAPR